jgi:hypothetical protein
MRLGAAYAKMKNPWSHRGLSWSGRRDWFPEQRGGRRQRRAAGRGATRRSSFATLSLGVWLCTSLKSRKPLMFSDNPQNRCAHGRSLLDTSCDTLAFGAGWWGETVTYPDGKCPALPRGSRYASSFQRIFFFDGFCRSPTKRPKKLAPVSLGKIFDGSYPKLFRPPSMREVVGPKNKIKSN